VCDDTTLNTHSPITPQARPATPDSQFQRHSDAYCTIRASVMGPLAYAAIFWLLLLPLGLLFLVVGLVCRAITALFSRSRELEADAGAARLTGNPAALASALMILSGTPPDTIPLVDLRRAASLDVFHIVAIGKEYPLVHTHPPLRRRLEQLSDIETRLQSPGLG